MNMSEPIADSEHDFTTHDGVSLHYRYWPARLPRRGAVVMFHRGHEHSGRMAHLVEELNLPDFDFFAWDARGHGKSPGVRGYSPSLSCSVRDVETFVRHVQTTYGIAVEDMAILAQSVGAVLTSTWVHDYAPQIRCLLLASPAFKVKLYVPLARPGLRLLQCLRGNFFVSSYVKAKYLTHDLQRQASYDSDPLISRSISVNILLDLYETADRIVSDAHAITAPTLLLISEKDWVVDHAPQHAFFANLGSTTKEKHVLRGFLHDTLGERDRQPAIDATRDFILRQFAAPHRVPDLRNADRAGVTYDETLSLSKPLPLLSLRGMYWALSRLNVQFGGLFSAGLRLGHETGFDSGSSLDYVYRNTAMGKGILGRLIDRYYLDAIGWRGIRQRKNQIEALLHTAMNTLIGEQREVKILDIAAGHGRYILDAVNKFARRPTSILLRDFDPINVQKGHALIEEKGLGEIARFEVGDAFDPAQLAAITPKANIGVVSGLYELFPDNARVAQSLSGIAEAVEPGGYLIYTGQPWHPQLEMIARTLTSHRGGKSWVMRRRTQAELDQLVAHAGFEKVEQLIDQWGIFTVSLARRKQAT